MNITEALLKQSTLKADLAELAGRIVANRSQEMLDGVVVEAPEYLIADLIAEYSTKVSELHALKLRLSKTNLLVTDGVQSLAEIILDVQRHTTLIGLYNGLLQNIDYDPYRGAKRIKDQSYTVAAFDKKQYRETLKQLQDNLRLLNAKISALNYTNQLS